MSGKRSPVRTTLRVALPTLAVLVLRQRAKDRHVNVSAVIEDMILETVMLDELQAMAKQFRALPASPSIDFVTP